MESQKTVSHSSLSIQGTFSFFTNFSLKDPTQIQYKQIKIVKFFTMFPISKHPLFKNSARFLEQY